MTDQPRLDQLPLVVFEACDSTGLDICKRCGSTVANGYLGVHDRWHTAIEAAQQGFTVTMQGRAVEITDEFIAEALTSEGARRLAREMSQMEGRHSVPSDTCSACRKPESADVPATLTEAVGDQAPHADPLTQGPSIGVAERKLWEALQLDPGDVPDPYAVVRTLVAEHFQRDEHTPLGDLPVPDTSVDL